MRRYGGLILAAQGTLHEDAARALPLPFWRELPPAGIGLDNEGIQLNWALTVALAAVLNARHGETLGRTRGDTRGEAPRIAYERVSGEPACAAVRYATGARPAHRDALRGRGAASTAEEVGWELVVTAEGADGVTVAEV